MRLYRGLSTILAVSIAVGKMFRNAFLDPYGLRETLRLAASLGIISLGLSIVFRAGIWNIGAEGQYILGGLAAGYVVYVLGLGHLGPVAPLLIGGVYGVWRDPETGFPVTQEIPAYYRLPDIGGVVGGLIIMVLLAPILHYLLFHTRYGFTLRVYGLNREAAEYAGYNRMAIIVGGLFISGVLSGLAGSGDLLGSYYRLMPRFSSGLGYTGIIVALLASNHPLIVPIASILFAGFLYGSYTWHSSSRPSISRGGLDGWSRGCSTAGNRLVHGPPTSGSWGAA